MTDKENVLAAFPTIVLEIKAYDTFLPEKDRHNTYTLILDITSSKKILAVGLTEDEVWKLAWEQVQLLMIKKLETTSADDEEVRMWQYEMMERQRWQDEMERRERELYNDLWEREYGKS